MTLKYNIKKTNLKMRSTKRILLFSFILVFSFINKGLSSEIKDRYTILSEIQTNNENGTFEAIGNVEINSDNNFRASSDKLIYEKKESKLKLIGNVKIDNYQIEDIFIENILSDELILFLETGKLIINSKEGERVKSKLKF